MALGVSERAHARLCICRLTVFSRICTELTDRVIKQTNLVEPEVQDMLHPLPLHLVQQIASNEHGVVDLLFAPVVELDAVVPEGDDVVAAACVSCGVSKFRKM